MKQFTLFFLINFALLACSKKTTSDPSFSLHLFQEPLHFDTAKQRGSSASYLFNNILRGLYRFDQKQGLVPEGGKCLWKTEQTLICDIIDQFWSNGEMVTSHDYIRAFHHMIDPQSASPRAHLFRHLKNGESILLGQKKPQSLGVEALSKNQLKFSFAKKDSEFLYKLTSTALFPLHEKSSFNKRNYKNFIGNGPYQIQSWDRGQKMVLKPNPYYKKGHSQRPFVTFYFIDDEMTAFRLYQNKKLSFLRRIPSKMISQIKEHPDFFQVPMARFDYIGFGQNLRYEKDLREALAHAIDYKTLKKILHALGRPGCSTFPKEWTTKKLCYNFDLKRARSLFAKVSPEIKNNTYQLKVSQMGGNDIKKQAEFYQNQWKTHLGFNVEIQQVEQKAFLNELRNQPPDIFRKGVGLDRPTCLSALETLSSESTQNFIAWNNKDYEKIIKQMAKESDLQQYKNLCTGALESLINSATIIPLGEMHFSLLASPKFKGWRINSMNQLDLSRLHSVKK